MPRANDFSAVNNVRPLDVSRSFVPVEPNSYPENLHGAEEFPEDRKEVVPYMGHNFLPTAYGYKSFFGTNAALDFDTLNPNKPDHVFIFQTLTYKNVAIALCDTGIWIKGATVDGAWTNLFPMTAPTEGTFYEWSYFVIKNKLYCYRTNYATYQLIETDETEDLDILLTDVTPTFINAVAQLGMFRLGSRVAFWDGTNAVAWSAADDHSDFTPAVLTGANVTTFNSINGKISAVRAHGKHAIAYASKSVVALTVDTADTFLVKAEPLIPGAGVPYNKQTVAGVPDTTHYCFSTVGIFRIENGKPEPIIPEVFDYLKRYNQTPTYLKILQGRYLAFETMDPDAIAGIPLFTTVDIPEQSIVFPGNTNLDDSWANPDTNICEIIDIINDGSTPQQQAMLPATPNIKPGTTAQPLYTGYFSNGAQTPSPISWTATPCAFNGWDMSPTTEAGKVSQHSTDSTNKTVLTGAELYLDGKLTIERFIAIQMGLWADADARRDAYLNELSSRSFSSSSTSWVPSPLPDVVNGDSDCDLGDYITRMSEPKFGYNGCSFWLTRYATAQKNLQTVGLSNAVTDPGSIQYTFSSWRFSSHDWCTTSSGYIYGSAASAVDAARIAYNACWGYVPSDPGYDRYGYYNLGDMVVDTVTAGTSEVLAYRHPALPNLRAERTVLTTNYQRSSTASANNEFGTENTDIEIPDTGYAVLTHWKYVDTNGDTQIVAASGSCTGPDRYPNSGSPIRVVGIDEEQPVPIDEYGTVCGELEEPSDIIDWHYDWPDQTVTYPASSFLMQDGSIAPIYPTMYGAFVYDLHLKKWGKYKDTYKCLLDYSPVNSDSNTPVSFRDFGILAGAHKDNGFIYLFDDGPTDSEITWGKLGYYRAGMSKIEALRFDFADYSSGTVTIDGSIDGISVLTPLTTETTFANVRQVTAHPPYSAKWFNVTLSGKYDVSYCELLGLTKGKGRR
jgi:hypothetical protein